MMDNLTDDFGIILTRYWHQCVFSACRLCKEERLEVIKEIVIKPPILLPKRN